MEPFSSYVNFDSGVLEQFDNKVTRCLSDMKGMFADTSAYEKAIGKEDSVVYEVYEKKVPENNGQLAHAVTVIKPGKIGNEFYMTKGHFHVIEDTAELYLGISGQGGIIMETKDGKSKYIDMKTGSLVYVSPYWAHRTVNISDKDFSFLAIYPANAGHDYGSIEEKGFDKIIIEKDGSPQVLDNFKQ